MTYVRYTGSMPVTFSNPDQEVFPGDVFSVEDGLLDSYLQRSDITLADVDDGAPVETPVDPVPTTKTTVKTKTAD